MAVRSATRVALGGGMAAGRWAEKLVELGESEGAVIVSAYPSPLVPYDRTLLSKGLMDLDNEASKMVVAGGLPVLRTRAGDLQDLAWYATHGITILFGMVCESVDLKVLAPPNPNPNPDHPHTHTHTRTHTQSRDPTLELELDPIP